MQLHFWVYMLRCADGRYYTGHTDDIEKRLWQHQQGLGSGFTKRRLPVALVWSADFPTRAEALEFEYRLKSWSRAKKEALMRGDWQAVSHFARPPGERFLASGRSLDFARDRREGTAAQEQRREEIDKDRISPIPSEVERSFPSKSSAERNQSIEGSIPNASAIR